MFTTVPMLHLTGFSRFLTLFGYYLPFLQQSIGNAVPKFSRFEGGLYRTYCKCHNQANVSVGCAFEVAEGTR